MPRIVIVGILLAVGVAVWLLISENPSTPDPVLPEAGTNPNAGSTGGDPGMRGSPRDMPAMKELELQASAGLVMIARLRTTWTATIELTLEALKGLDYRTWYAISIDPSTGPGGGFAGVGRGLPELRRAPTGSYLEDNDIRVLVVDEVDPNQFPLSFWNVVAERVRAGKMGLYFRPGVPFDEKNQALASHQALTHPVLKELLPVKTAIEIKGSPPPGVFQQKQLLKPTDAGFRHPATQLVPVERGSRSLWATAATGEGAIGSRFCYPVQEMKPDAVALINLEAGVDLPAVIVSSGDTRVLWMGNTDFGDRKTHFDRKMDAIQKTLLNHWWVWLSGVPAR